MKLLTKVAKGIAYGDVSNMAIRNILTEISKYVFGGITEQEMDDTMAFFDWKCPYTGKNVRALREGKGGKCATDHIYPQNKEYCGLNVMGNLVLVDYDANKEKMGKTPEEFFNNPNSKVLAGVDSATRAARLKKIKEFQAKYGYDPKQIKDKLAPLLAERYDELRREQEEFIDKALLEAGLKRLSPPKTTVKKSLGRTLPPIMYYVGTEQVDEIVFKNELLCKKTATFRLTYDSGAIKYSQWKADQFQTASSLTGNIQSRPFWRARKEEGLVCVEVII